MGLWIRFVFFLQAWDVIPDSAHTDNYWKKRETEQDKPKTPNTVASMSQAVALITGAASGIGLALTGHLVGKGWRFVMADMNEESGTKVSKKFGDQVAILDFKHTFSSSAPRSHTDMGKKSSMLKQKLL